VGLAETVDESGAGVEDYLQPFPLASSSGIRSLRVLLDLDEFAQKTISLAAGRGRNGGHEKETRETAGRRGRRKRKSMGQSLL